MILVLKPSTKCEQISNKHFLALKYNSDSLVLGQNGREIDKEAMESLCFSQDDARENIGRLVRFEVAQVPLVAWER